MRDCDCKCSYELDCIQQRRLQLALGRTRGQARFSTSSCTAQSLQLEDCSDRLEGRSEVTSGLQRFNRPLARGVKRQCVY